MDGKLGVHRGRDVNSTIQASQKIELLDARQGNERPGIRHDDASHDAALISSSSSSGG